MKKPSLTGFSTALFSTWYFYDEMAALFDCGDGVCLGLLQKSRKIKHVFLSHADRDHVAGLLQFCQLNGRAGLHIYYPADCRSLGFLKEFCLSFDPQTPAATWHPVRHGEVISVRSDLQVRAVRNTHVPVDGNLSKSLSYFVDRISRKLKSQFAGQPAEVIVEARQRLGEEGISDISKRTELVYGADTPVIRDGRYDEAEILIHEATFLTAEELEPDNPKRNKHSSLDQVIELAAEVGVKELILGHFSSRYSWTQIQAAVNKERKRFRLDIPVHCILPGMLARNILEME